MQGESVKVEISLVTKPAKKSATPPPTAWKTTAAAKPTFVVTPPSYDDLYGPGCFEYIIFALALAAGFVGMILVLSLALGLNKTQAVSSPQPTPVITNAPILCYAPNCTLRTFNPSPLPSTKISALSQSYSSANSSFDATQTVTEDVWPVQVSDPKRLVISYGASYHGPGLSDTNAGNVLTAQLLDEHHHLIARLSDPTSLYQFMAADLPYSGLYYLTIQIDTARVHYLTDPNSPVTLNYFFQLSP
jgi:hypothetical protein